MTLPFLLSKQVSIRDRFLNTGYKTTSNFSAELSHFQVFNIIHKEVINQVDVISLAQLLHTSEFVIFESCLIWKFVGVLNHLNN